MAYTPHSHHFINGIPCLDFANTVVWRNNPQRCEDRLSDERDLSAWAGAASLARPEMGLAGAIAMREAIDRYFRSGAKRQGWAELVRLYAAALAAPDRHFPRIILHQSPPDPWVVEVDRTTEGHAGEIPLDQADELFEERPGYTGFTPNALGVVPEHALRAGREGELELQLLQHFPGHHIA